MNENKRIYLSVTETSDPCPRTWELEAAYKTGRLNYKPNETSHFYGARGMLTHYTLEQFFLKNPVQWNYEWFVNNDNIKEHIPEWLFDECLPFVKEKYNIAINCIQENPDLFRDVIVEERMFYSIDDTFVLTGKPDLKTDVAIVDWKSNKYSKANARKAFKQCFGYDYLITKSDKPKYRSHIVIFLGGDKARIVRADEQDRAEAMDAFIKDLLAARILKKQAYAGKHLPAKFSFICSMCRFNNYCRGI